MANILIIEDDPTLQEAYGFVLSTAGHGVEAAYNGKEGLALATSKTFDLILLDIHMPVMNGWEFLEAYKKAKTKCPKIIVFSNMVEPEFHKQAKSLGADRCILKSSMTPKEMIELIEKETK